jgi:hypothetical protein
MQIQVNTDNNIDGREALAAHIEAEVTATLSRFSDHITRIEVHLGDESAGRSTGDDQRCMLEARTTGQAPVTVVHHADTLDAAFRGALHKLNGLLTSKIDRLDDRNARASIRDLPEADHREHP